MLDDYYAVSELSGVINRTRDLLWPFHWGVWLRIAVIALFIGGGFNFPGNYTFDEFPSGGGLPDLGANISLLLIVAGILILLAILWALAGSILQFVFVDCLTSGEVSLSRTFSQRAGKGIRLFLFDFALVILLILLIAAPAALFLAPVIVGGAAPGSIGGAAIGVAVLLWILFILVLIIPFALVGMFTTDFVVPVMIREDAGVIEAWRRVFRLLLSEWQQAAVYVVARIVLGLATGILLFIAVLLALLIIAIPFVIIGVAAAAFIASYLWLLVLLLIPFLLIVIPVMLLLPVPFVTFFRFYSLQVLGKLEPRYALLPEPSGPAGDA